MNDLCKCNAVSSAIVSSFYVINLNDFSIFSFIMQIIQSIDFDLSGKRQCELNR